MGKKLISQASPLKISKDHNQKQKFNSLIEVLRPKVYITDISSFKKLVQDLTGSGNANGSSSTTSSPPLEPKVVASAEDIQRDLLEASLTSTETTTTTNDSSQSCYTALMNEEVFNQVSNQKMCLDDTFLLEEYSMPNQTLDHDLLACQNLESLLFDDEPHPCYDCYSQIEQEISIYDYELSGLL